MGFLNATTLLMRLDTLNLTVTAFWGLADKIQFPNGQDRDNAPTLLTGKTSDRLSTLIDQAIYYDECSYGCRSYIQSESTNMC